MLEIQDEIEAINKKKTVTVGAGYKYRGVEDVLDEVAPAVRKAQVFIRPEAVSADYTREKVQKFNASGAVIGERFDTVCVLKMNYHFTAEDGSSVQVGPICGEGMDSGDKATSKANSICYKLAMIAAFSIPVNDMPEIEDMKTDLRDMPDIKTTKAPTKEEHEELTKLIEGITQQCADATKGLTKDKKTEFITTKLGLKAFSDLKKMNKQQLNLISQKIMVMGIDINEK